MWGSGKQGTIFDGMSESVPAIVHGHEKVRNYQNMNHIVKRIGILTGVFAAALCVFFLANNRWNSGQDQAVYMDTVRR